MHKLELFGRYPRLAAAIVTSAGTIGASALMASASDAALPAGCSQSGQIVSCTQTFTTGSNPFTVPAGVSSIHVTAVGGKGFSGDGPGGFGAEVAGNLAASPGQTFYAVVGSNGSDPPNFGGAEGGVGGGAETNHLSQQAGAGGASSDVRTSPNDLSTRLLVASGGGGGGGGPFGSTAGGAGGAGGSHDGTGAGDTGGAGGGGGATEDAGGTGGSAGAAGSCGFAFCVTGGAGDAGGSGPGGDGGSPGLGAISAGFPPSCPTGLPIMTFACIVAAGGGGGGGGGGLFGGGGGGGAGLSLGGGGGGGSNLVPPGGTASVDTTGVPMVQISYKLMPTSKAQCMNGGWQDYPQFTNQGNCVSFVETGK